MWRNRLDSFFVISLVAAMSSLFFALRRFHKDNEANVDERLLLCKEADVQWMGNKVDEDNNYETFVLTAWQ